ncbi:MAG TPA: acetamidase/formamidase family protein [Chthonomonadales bacterium]|nr:acetamidase/formamidase family protein [Chthonomonadales bacterium]
MAVFAIEPTRETLHGAFSKDLPAVLEIDSGDTVQYRLLDASWSLPGAEGEQRRRFEPRIPDRDDGHALCGPVRIRGAHPGMTLEVRIDKLVPAREGWTVAGGWKNGINERLGIADEGEYRLSWLLDAAAGTAVDQNGRKIGLCPFLGVMGMPADVSGWTPSWRPRVNGGNLDCKELQAGSSIFLPVAVEGGLFSAGDGHGRQGDGEVSSTAIECGMERAELTFILRSALTIGTPRAWTPEGWLTLGFSEDLDEAAHLALEAMIDLMQEQHEFKRKEAVAFASLAVDLRITQICNGVKGVHAMLPHNVLARSDSHTAHHERGLC